MIIIALPVPSLSISPYWPDQTVAKASNKAIIKPRTKTLKHFVWG